MKVSLIVTTLNEAKTIDGLIKAVEAQSRAPDEIVVVDGGSSDGTFEALQEWASSRPTVVVKSLPGANISAGRNAAIKEAAGQVIAATDAGCTPEPEWLERLMKPFETDDVDVVMGFYRADPHSTFERVAGCLNLPDAHEIKPGRFMPSSRSVAFTKPIWERAGGYPEWLDIGEDMYFNFQMLERGARRAFAPEAVVRWRLRPTLEDTLRQYFRYAEGDGRAGMYPQRHALRFLTYAGGVLLLAASTRKPVLLWIPAAFGVARMLPAFRRAWRRLPPAEAAAATVALPALELLVDLAKMAGYVSGRKARKAK